MWSSTGSPVALPSANSGNARQGAQGGFTLLEVLVAFAILAVALTVLVRVFSGALNAIEIAQRHTTATMLARSVVEQIGIEIPLVGGVQSGVSGDGFTWTLRIARSTLLEPVVDAQALQVPYEVEVSVAWNGSPLLALRTLRMASELDAGDADFDGSRDPGDAEAGP